ncbi:MAG: putative Ig domain-containing protein, partial [Desulfuromonadales bacterium]|nr:putative Ig domain-containing protein [Desulfuromonadales bacterium]
DNAYGQIDVGDWSDIVAVAADANGTVGLKADGTVLAAGDVINIPFYDAEYPGLVDVALASSAAVSLDSGGRVWLFNWDMFYTSNYKNPPFYSWRLGYTQPDNDLDGMPDICDPCPNDRFNDVDADGVCGSADNCPNLSNPDQTDTDGDGFGDACQPPPTTNTPPQITSTPILIAHERVEYRAFFSATDADDDPLTLSAPLLPEWLTFSSSTGLINGTPSYSDAGEHAVTLTVSDGADVTEQSFTITVSFIDSDGDGLADGWEADNGFDPSVDNSQADSDGDGISNLDEFLAGTDPNVFNESGTLAPPELSCDTTGKNVSVIWTAVPGATGYILSYVPYPYNGHDVIATVDVGDATSFNATLWHDAAYMIAVQAYNEHGNSPHSNLDHFTIELAPPASPVLSYNLSGKLLELSWSSVADAEGYLLSYSPLPYSGPESITTLDMGVQTTVQYALSLDSAFLIAVQAYNGGGVSAYSEIKEVSRGE